MFAPFFILLLVGGLYGQLACEPGYQDCENHPYLYNTRKALQD